MHVTIDTFTYEVSHMFDRLLDEQDVQDIQQEERRREIEALEQELARIQQEELQAQQQQQQQNTTPQN